MRILFINHTFPGLFSSLAAAFGAESRHEVLFASSYGRRQEVTLPGVRKIRLSPHALRARTAAEELDNMMAAGRQALHSFEILRESGFVPDMVLSSSRGGYALFWGAAFPDSFRVCWTESCTSLPDAEAATDPFFARHLVLCRQVMDCDLVVALSAGQPGYLQDRLKHAVELPYAVNTRQFAPGNFEALEQDGLDLTALPELLVLAVSRTLAQSSTLSLLLEHLCTLRPRCHVLLFCDTLATQGNMRTLCPTLAAGRAGRLHVSGMLSLNKYKTLLSQAAAWVYPPDSRVQAVSLLEAMSCGAALILSKDSFASPLLQDGDNVLFLEEKGPREFARRLDGLLNQKNLLQKVRLRARATVVEHCAQEHVLPLQTHFLEQMYQIWKEQGTSGLTAHLEGLQPLV